MYFVIQVICRLLDPKISEYTAMFTGRLVSMLISRMGHQLGEDLDLMLRGVLSKMQQVEALSVMQVRSNQDCVHYNTSCLKLLQNIPDNPAYNCPSLLIKEYYV